MGVRSLNEGYEPEILTGTQKKSKQFSVSNSVTDTSTGLSFPSDKPDSSRIDSSAKFDCISLSCELAHYFSLYLSLSLSSDITTNFLPLPPFLSLV